MSLLYFSYTISNLSSGSILGDLQARGTGPPTARPNNGRNGLAVVNGYLIKGRNVISFDLGRFNRPPYFVLPSTGQVFYCSVWFARRQLDARGE